MPSAVTGGLIQTGEPPSGLVLSSSIGFTRTVVGPAIFGVILDWAGGECSAAWITAFAGLIRAALVLFQL